MMNVQVPSQLLSLHAGWQEAQYQAESCQVAQAEIPFAQAVTFLANFNVAG